MQSARRSDVVLVRRWLALAVGSLLLSGLLSLALVIGRLPGIHDLFTDPLFFRRGLVVHVVLALVVWFTAFLTALYFTIGSRRPPGIAARLGPGVAAGGVVAMVIATGTPGTAPVLCNYVPVIDHSIFVLGLVAYGVGVAMSLASRRLSPRGDGAGALALPAASRVGIRAGALLLLLAGATFLAGVLSTPSGLPTDTAWELRMWGGGHVMQMASVAGMTAIWFVLLSLAIGRSPISRRTASFGFALLVLPFLGAPLLAFAGTADVSYHAGFTTLMRWWSWPVPTVFLVLCVRAVVRARREGTLTGPALRNPYVAAFAISALMTVVGFGIGALIRGPTTTIPAHYHASIGAVTAAYMAVTWPLLARVGVGSPRGWIGRHTGVQPIVFGIGQLVFAIGFGTAGLDGMARKVYATDQHIRTAAEWLGLGVMGVGGLVAVAGGVLFLWGAISAWRAPARDAREDGELVWKTESIRSNG